MNNQPAISASRLIVNGSTLLHLGTLILLASLLASMAACTTGRTGPASGQKIRLNVGDIKEVNIATRADTTWQLLATSDNQEVVDVSRKPPIAKASGGRPGTAVFLIKGVTVGTARVVFSEKQLGANGDGQVKKTYTVTVTSK